MLEITIWLLIQPKKCNSIFLSPYSTSGQKTVYAIDLSQRTEEVFETLADLVEKVRKRLNLGDNFLELDKREMLNTRAISKTADAPEVMQDFF